MLCHWPQQLGHLLPRLIISHSSPGEKEGAEVEEEERKERIPRKGRTLRHSSWTRALENESLCHTSTNTTTSSTSSCPLVKIRLAPGLYVAHNPPQCPSKDRFVQRRRRRRIVILVALKVPGNCDFRRKSQERSRRHGSAYYQPRPPSTEDAIAK